MLNLLPHPRPHLRHPPAPATSIRAVPPRGLLLAAGLALGVCAHLPAQSAFTIPFTYENDFVVVEARLNGVYATRLLFDTGSEHTILTEPLLFPALAGAALEPIRLVGSDLSTVIEAGFSRRNDVSVGDVTLANQAIVAVDDDALDLGALAGEDVGGILGIGAFGAYVIVIDYRRGVLRLVPPERYDPPRGAIALPLARTDGKPHLRLATRVHAAYRDTLTYLLDTGAALETLIFAAPADSAVYPPAIVAGVIGYGLGGTLQGFVGRTDTLALPGRPLPGVITHFQVVPEAPEAGAVARDGIVGNRLLSRFVVALDLPNARAYLTPRRRRPRRRPYDRSGLTLVAEPGARGALLVQFVAPGTPAAEAGVRRGDRIRKVNRLPVRLRSAARVTRLLRRRPGKTVRLQLEREGRLRTVEVVLRDLI